MGYNKFIASGEYFELYEYEKNRFEYSKVARGYKNVLNKEDLGDSGKDVVAKRVMGKRQDNARRATMAFRRLVLCNLRGRANPLLVTLTYAENIVDLRRGYKDFSAFIKALRYKYGAVFRYVAVPEFQKRGAVHFHALFWDLPCASEIYARERAERSIANLWSHGFVDVFLTDGHEKISGYLAKYMAKALKSSKLAGFKAYVGSRNLDRPIVGSGFDNVWPVLHEWGLSTAEPVLLKRFSTYWLGQGRYSVYKLIE